MKLEVGKYYKTYGGWRALIIWDMDEDSSFFRLNDSGIKINWEGQPRYYVIHKPKEEDEKPVITHNSEGGTITEFSVGEPPLFGKHHPADLKEEWK